MLAKKILTNTFFNISSQIILFFFNLIHARILIPEYFGIYTIGLVSIEIGKLFTLDMFKVSLIQYKDLKVKHYVTVLFVNLLFSFFVLGCLNVFKHKISSFMDSPEIINCIPIISLCLIFFSFEMIPRVYLSRNLYFFELGFSNFISVLVFGISTIIFWHFNFGYLSLINGYLLRVIAEFFIKFLFMVKKVQKFKFEKPSVSAFKDISKMGYGLILQQQFNYLGNNLDYIIIGKVCGTEALGYYRLAFQIMLKPVSQLTQNINTVLLPVFSRIQDNDKDITAKLITVTKHTAFLTIPGFLGISLYSDEIVRILFGEKWMAAADVLGILCFAGVIKSFAPYFGDILKAKGIVYKELLLKVFISFIFLVLGLIIASRSGIEGIAYLVNFLALVNWIGMFLILNMVINIKFYEYISTLIKPVLISAILLIFNSLLIISVSDIKGLVMIIMLNFMIFMTLIIFLGKDTLFYTKAVQLISCVSYRKK